MPQLDIFSYFSAATTLIVIFLSLIFILHTYFLPKIASCLKFPKKIQLKQQVSSTTFFETHLEKKEPFLDLANTYMKQKLQKEAKKKNDPQSKSSGQPNSCVKSRVIISRMHIYDAGSFNFGSGYKKSHRALNTSLRLRYPMVWQTPMFLNVQICRVEKRYMLNLARRLLYGEQGNIPRNARSFATWNLTSRRAEPIKEKAPKMEIDPETGLEIMNPIDYSGQNHLLLDQSDYKCETFHKIWGSFTTSQSPFQGKKPIWIGCCTLEGHKKLQYLHIYDKPRLLRRSDSVGIAFTSESLPDNATIDKILARFSKTVIENNGQI